MVKWAVGRQSPYGEGEASRLPCPAPPNTHTPQVVFPPGEKEQNLDHWEDTLPGPFLPLSRLLNKLGRGTALHGGATILPSVCPGDPDYPHFTGGQTAHTG